MLTVEKRKLVFGLFKGLQKKTSNFQRLAFGASNCGENLERFQVWNPPRELAGIRNLLEMFCPNCLIYKQMETFISSRHLQNSVKFTKFAALTSNMTVDSSLSH